MALDSKPFVFLLRDRENGASKSSYRLTCRMLRSLFESPNRRYGRRVWQQPKQKYVTAPWFVEEGSRLLVNSRQTCLSTLLPKRPLFHVDTFVSRPSIVLDVLFCQSPLESIGCLRNGVGNLEENGVFIFLFKLGFLELRSANTGHLIQRVFLSKSPLAKMHEMNWNISQESFVISSVCQPRRPPGQQQRTSGDVNDVVISFMLFNVFPLKFTYHLQIRRSIFGTDVISADIHHDILLVLHSAKSMIRVYSMKHLLEQSEKRTLTIGERDPVSMLVVGTFPDGIPVNVETAILPPLLFEVSSYGHHLEMVTAGIGADRATLLCVVCPLRAPFQFNVVDALKRSALKNGMIEDHNNAAVMPHRLFTHPDDTSRLIYVTGSKVIVYEFIDKGGEKRLEVQFTCETSVNNTKDEDPTKMSPPSPSLLFSASGRAVKRRAFYGNPVSSAEMDGTDEDVSTVVSVSYSSELELLALLVCTIKSPSESVMFYDNLTGRLIKIVQLPLEAGMTRNGDRTPCYDEEQYIGLTFDTIVHCRREAERHSSRWTCAIYSNVFNEQ